MYATIVEYEYEYELRNDARPDPQAHKDGDATHGLAEAWPTDPRGEEVHGPQAREKIEQPAVLTVVNVRRECLAEMIRDLAYGDQECALEGFPDYSPIEFVEMFCRAHKGADFTTEVTRIEFEYSAATTVRMAAG